MASDWWVLAAISGPILGWLVFGGKISYFAIGRFTLAVILGGLAAIRLLVDLLLVVASLWRSAWLSGSVIG